VLVLRRVGLAVVVALAAACSISTQPTPGRGEAEPVGDVEPAQPGQPTDPATGDVDEETKPEPEVPETETPPGDILGTLSGSCGIVKTLLTTGTPTFEKNALAFVAGETYEAASLSTEGHRIMTTPNAGGSSVESEVMSFEVLRACEGAKLLKTETEVKYLENTTGPSTDILVEIGGKRVGVSVTRAYRPKNQTFPDADVKSLIQKKLEDVNKSSARVKPEDEWVKQILHVFASNQAQADAVARVLPTIDAAIRANTIVLLTQTSGGGFVYCNPDPPLGSECP